jgi:hypothetical protein
MNLSKHFNNLPFNERQNFLDEYQIPESRRRPRKSKEEKAKAAKKAKTKK